MPFTKPVDSPSGPSLTKSLISLAICIHLFCIAVVLASNFRRSPLQARLVSVFAPYTLLLHFDPEFVPYYYTLGRPVDDDTWLVIDVYAMADQPVDQQEIVRTVRLPEAGSNWLSERWRAFQLAKLLASNADPENENDDVTGEIARSVGGWAMRQSHAARAVVRCVRRMSQPYDLSTLNPGFPRENPTDPAYDATVYEADVWIDEDKQVQVQKRATRAEVAPRQPAAGSMPRGSSGSNAAAGSISSQ
jgi:hypothetical protein